VASNVDKYVTDAEHAAIDHTGLPGIPAGGVGDAFPIGAIVPFSATVASIPPGWRACDGFAYGRTGGDPTPEPDLFGVIGTTWGIGNGSTTFNVPDLRAKAPFSINDGTLPNGLDGAFTTRALADTTGVETHTHTGSIPSSGSHAHSTTTGVPSSNLPAQPPGGGSSGFAADSTHTHGVTISGDGDHTHGTVNNSTDSNLPPTAFMPYIIKARNVGGGSAGISGQANGAGTTNPQPTINVINGTNTTVMVVENVGQNRLDITVNASVPTVATYSAHVQNLSVGSNTYSGGSRATVGGCAFPSTHANSGISVFGASTSIASCTTWSITSSGTTAQASGQIYALAPVVTAPGSSNSWNLNNTAAIQAQAAWLAIN